MKRYIFLSLLFSGVVYAKTTVYFTPSPDCENNIIQVLNNAEHTINVAVYSFTNAKIANALLKAHEKGIAVRVLTDRTQAGNKSSQAITLYEKGVPIKVHSRFRIEHNKFMVVDGKTLETGSYNWTKSATDSNSENCLFITKEPETIAKYNARFEYLWRQNSEEKSNQWFSKRVKKKIPKNESFWDKMVRMFSF